MPQDRDNAHSCKHQRKGCKYTPAKLNKNMVGKQTCQKMIIPSPNDTIQTIESINHQETHQHPERLG